MAGNPFQDLKFKKKIIISFFFYLLYCELCVFYLHYVPKLQNALAHNLIEKNKRERKDKINKSNLKQV